MENLLVSRHFALYHHLFPSLFDLCRIHSRGSLCSHQPDEAGLIVERELDIVLDAAREVARTDLKLPGSS